MTAVLDGRSVDTTMGFSPLEGVPMATRPGTIDPEILLYLQRHAAATPAELEQALEHESGLLALGGSARVEELEASAEPGARLALSVFCYRVAAAVGAMTTALGGLEALVFTAGVGEGSALVRSRVCERLAFLGIELDSQRECVRRARRGRLGLRVGVRVWVVRAREDVVAARAARSIV